MMTQPASDRDLDWTRCGAGDGEEHVIVAAHVRGYGGTEGASLIIRAVALRAGATADDTRREMDAAAEALAKASRHDCGRDPDALSWAKVRRPALVSTFRASNHGILLDAMSFRGLEPDAGRVESVWHLQDPSFDLHSHLRPARGEAPVATSNGLSALPEEDVVKVVAGNIMRRLPSTGGDILVDGGPGGWIARPGGGHRVDRDAVAEALANSDIVRSWASRARRSGGSAMEAAAAAATGIQFASRAGAQGHPI